jgi:RNA polymerase sigma factor (sigma-70 family)
VQEPCKRQRLLHPEAMRQQVRLFTRRDYDYRPARESLVGATQRRCRALKACRRVVRGLALWPSRDRLGGMRTPETARDKSAASPSSEAGAGRAAFVTTHWSAVLAAGRSDTTRAEAALARLCQTYWYPLYAYVRRRGHDPHDAQDLTQEFFAHLLAQNWVAQADRERGRFRTFLLAALNHFLANEWDKARAQKRGGAVQLVPLQLDSAETRYGQEPADPLTPEQSFERRWAVALLEEVLSRLRQEHVEAETVELFDTLKPCLVGDRQAQPYAALGASLGMNEGAVKVAVHRLRQRYRRLLREEIANSVATAEEVNEEMRHLFTVLAR